ncbi:RlpA-like protein precursor [Phocoenobacter uteri]|uniref:Endolytic peptidoglycan transglycosylase RlpA n=1 Tax=Phocoenobacter uteri TaxID=146806 RepID=A0A379CDN6_9PAST|nr:septal ring lytic transglycosylase RlpA family protein [Phocoenobacter uteri]MDG6881788.1 hypothetical protein [Phocoenobacter uteri]SUB59825.1 RlpA-like protein precursor [Phocoenobacter uteri]
MKITKVIRSLLVAMLIIGGMPAIAKYSVNGGIKGAKLLPSKVSNHKYSYRDRGRKYTTLTPAESARYSAVGMASYYGGKFNGRKTANGEIFNENHFTAAHKTLAFGTYLLVTNLRNGRKLIVRVNDRGPFSNKRILDLSKRSARYLGMLKSGISKVKIEALQVDKDGYIFGKGTHSLLKIAKRSGLKLKVRSDRSNKAKVTHYSSHNIIVKVTKFKSEKLAKQIARVVKPKAEIKKNGRYFDVFIYPKDTKNTQKVKKQLALLTHNKVYTYTKSVQEQKKTRSSKAKIATNKIIVKVAQFKSKHIATKMMKAVKPKAEIKKNGKYYDVLIYPENVKQSQKVRQQLAILTHNKVYTYNTK